MLAERFGKLDAVGSTPRGTPQSSEPLPQRNKSANLRKEVGHDSGFLIALCYFLQKLLDHVRKILAAYSF
jgi:hypothetical protein